MVRQLRDRGFLDRDADSVRGHRHDVCPVDRLQCGGHPLDSYVYFMAGLDDMGGDKTFQPSMKIIEHTESFEVQGADGKALKYFYFDDNAKRRQVTGRRTRDQALRDARAFAGRGAEEVLKS